MANVKTAISLDKDLLTQVNRVAEELHISRSHLFALAAEEFIARRANQELLRHINDAYADDPSPTDEALLEGMSTHQRNVLEGEW